MKVGDKVTWSSQSGGFRKTKHGVVVAVVPAGEHPWGKGKGRDTIYVPEGFYLDTDGWCRDHESYLVQVGKSKKLYWPRAKHLALESSPKEA